MLQWRSTGIFFAKIWYLPPPFENGKVNFLKFEVEKVNSSWWFQCGDYTVYRKVAVLWTDATLLVVLLNCTPVHNTHHASSSSSIGSSCSHQQQSTLIFILIFNYVKLCTNNLSGIYANTALKTAEFMEINTAALMSKTFNCMAYASNVNFQAKKPTCLQMATVRH